MSIQDEFKQHLEDETLRMRLDRTPDRGVYIIDVGNVSIEEAETAIKKIKNKLNRIDN